MDYCLLLFSKNYWQFFLKSKVFVFFDKKYVVFF